MQGVYSIGEPMGFQHGPRRSKLVLFGENQGAQQVVSFYHKVAFGESLQKNPCSLGILVEERGSGGEQQDGAIAWLSAHGVFGLR
jgi:hypothetical protein